MTPQDIATDITAVNATGAINATTQFTYTMLGINERLDDTNRGGGVARRLPFSPQKGTCP